MTSPGHPSGALIPYLVPLFQKAVWSLATLWPVSLILPKEENGGEAETLSGSSRKNTHLKVQMVPHVMSASDHIS